MCREALQGSNNDLSQARQALRTMIDGRAKKIVNGAASMHEGLVGLIQKSRKLCLLKLTCQTDFVARSPAFAALVEKIALRHLERAPDLAKVTAEDAQFILETAGTLNEPIRVSDINIIELLPDCHYGTYIHNKLHEFAGTVACFVELHGSKSPGDLAGQLARHIAGMAPSSLSELEDQPFLFDQDGKTVRDVTNRLGCAVSRFERLSMR